MHLARLRRPEQPQKQIEEVNPDIRDDPAGPFIGTLPRDVIPAPASRDVGERHVVAPRRSLRAELIAQRDQLRMEPQLQDGVDAASGFLLELLQRVQVPRVDDERLLADRVRPDAQREPDVRVVQVVRRADGDVVHAAGVGAAAQLFEVTVEPLELGEEPHVEGVAIEHADRVVRIHRGDETIAGVLDRLQVAGRHEPGDAGQGEVHRGLAHRWLPSPDPATARSVAASFRAFTCTE